VGIDSSEGQELFRGEPKTIKQVKAIIESKFSLRPSFLSHTIPEDNSGYGGECF
jgi:hypothetical protein